MARIVQRGHLYNGGNTVRNRSAPLIYIHLKSLRLTILLEAGISKAELANTFGDLKEIIMPVHKWAQFRFNNVKMLTPIQLIPVYNLLLSYEQKHGQLGFKMFHLYDDVDNTYSPISLQAYRSMWAVTNSSTGVDMNVGPNLLTLIK